MKKYNIMTLCGSTRFKKDFERADKELTLNGNIVISPCFFGDSDEPITEQQKIVLGDIHKHKIDLADEIFVINKDNYIGQSTQQEIAYAFANNKKIRFLENPKCDNHSWEVIDCCGYKGDDCIEMCSSCHKPRWKAYSLDDCNE